MKAAAYRAAGHSVGYLTQSSCGLALRMSLMVLIEGEPAHQPKTTEQIDRLVYGRTYAGVEAALGNSIG